MHQYPVAESAMPVSVLTRYPATSTYATMKLLNDFVRLWREPVAKETRPILGNQAMSTNSSAVAGLSKESKYSEHTSRIMKAFVPAVPSVCDRSNRVVLGLNGRKAICTFGLINPGKGLESMIQAMPQIVARFPEAIDVLTRVAGKFDSHSRPKSFQLSNVGTGASTI